MYGVGVEVGPKDIGLGGITGNSGIRLRFQTETYDFDSFRPTAGVISTSDLVATDHDRRSSFNGRAPFHICHFPCAAKSSYAPIQQGE